MNHRPRLAMLLGLSVLSMLTPRGVLAQTAGGQGAVADVFAQHVWLAWAIVAAIGLAAGATEIVAKYRDEPRRALSTQPAILYMLINAGASVIALFMIKELNWDFGVNADQVNLVQIIVAGFGAMIILRAAVFTIRAPGKEAMVGPVNVLQTVLDACDRAVDRKRASERAAEVSKLMQDISFERAIVELPMVSLALMQNLSNEEQVRLRARVDDLRGSRLSNEGKCLSLGLVLLGSLGVEALEAAIATVRTRIELGESMEPVIDFMHPTSIPAETIAAAMENNEDIPLTLSGQRFDSLAKVLLNGDVQTTDFEPLTQQLKVMLSAATLNTLPEHEVTVFTRTNNGGESAPSILRLEGVNPIPDLVSIDPDAISAETVAAGGEILLTVSGADFVSGSEVRIDGQKQGTAFVSDLELAATVDAAVLAAPGDHQVTVFNPVPHGGESPPLVLAVVAAGEPVVVVPGQPVPPPTPPDGAAGAAPPAAEGVSPDAGTAPQAEEAAPPVPLDQDDVRIITAAEAAAAGRPPRKPV